MSTPTLIAIGLALAAVIGLCFHMPDRWFFTLLALACLLGSADAAYRDRKLDTVLLLIGGAVCTGAAAHAAHTASRERNPR
ncbi:hypothetical protein ACIP6V_23665 [Streptomyces sp. NPDC088770]|uniref:hypothetical protein n=1 Tax=Streptomyces sp. NPDC088770 TaxID=3365895 RepID=UPI0037F7050E